MKRAKHMKWFRVCEDSNSYKREEKAHEEVFDDILFFSLLRQLHSLCCLARERDGFLFRNPPSILEGILEDTVLN